MADLDTLSGISMKKVLEVLINLDDSGFKQVLGDLLLNWDINGSDENNEKYAGDVLKVLNERIQDMYPNERISPKLLKDELHTIVSSKETYAFIRVIKSLNKLLSYMEIPEVHMSEYMDLLKFSMTRGVDLYEMSKFYLYQTMRKRELLIDRLEPQYIDFLTSFSPEGLRTISKFKHLTIPEINFILSLNEREIRIYNKLGPNTIHSLLNLEDFTKMSIFDLNRSRLNELMNNPHELLQNFGLTDDEHNASVLLNKIVQLNQEELQSLNRMITQSRQIMLELSEKAQDVIMKIDTMKLPDNHLLLNLNDQDQAILRDMITSEDFNYMTKVSQNYGEETLDLFRSLRTEQKQFIIGMGDRRLLSRIASLDSSTRSKLELINKLEPEEEQALLNLSDEQRRVLAKITCLREDGIKLISTMTSDEVSEVFQSFRSQPAVNDRLNLSQRVLFRRINYLNSEDKAELLSLTDDNWNAFEELKGSKNPLTFHLSWKGRIVLKKMSKYTQQQLRIVESLRLDRGMAVLTTNSNLTPEEITRLGSMKPDEARLILNMNLQQRHHIRTLNKRHWRLHQFFQPKDIEILNRLVATNEALLMKLTRFDVQEARIRESMSMSDSAIIENLQTSEIEMMLTLNQDQIKILASSFDWQIERNSPFLMWNHMLDPIRSDQEKRENIKKYMTRVFDQLDEDSFFNTSKFTKLIAAVTVAGQTGGYQQFEIVEDIVNMMSERSQSWCSSQLLFYLYNFSMSDQFREVYLSEFLKQVNEDSSRLEYLGTTIDATDDEELSQFRRRLVDTAELRTDPFYEIVNYNLLTFTISTEKECLQKIMTINDGIPLTQILRALRYQLKDQHFYLTQKLFFSQGRDSNDVSEWLSNILDENDQSKFLNLPVDQDIVNGNSLRIGYLYRNNIFEEPELRQPNVFECSLYYDRSDALPMLEKLNDEKLSMLFNRYPSALIRYGTCFGRIKLLQFFVRRIGPARLHELISDKTWQIVVDFISSLDSHNFSITTERHQDLIDTIHWLTKIEPHLPARLYREMATKCVLLPQLEKSIGHLNFLLDNLANELIPRGELMQILKQHRDKEIRALLVAETGEGCSSNEMRKKRSMLIRCVDSEIDETHEEELFQIKKEDIEFYDQLLRLVRETSDDQRSDLLQSIMKTTDDMNYKLVDPDVMTVVEDLKANAKDELAVKNILSRSGLAETIETAASSVGLAFTIFFVGKHLMNGDFQGLGYDEMNLMLFPAIGKGVSDSLISWTEGTDTFFTEIFAPNVGRGIANFGAFIQLIDAIKMKYNSTENSFKEHIADLNIMSSTFFVSADVPAMIAQFLRYSGYNVGLAGELAGPIGFGLSVFIMLTTAVLELHDSVEEVSKEIQLTGEEHHDLYFDLFFKSRLPNNIEYDIEAKKIYDRYINNTIDRYKRKYGRIAITIPALKLKSGIYMKSNREKRQLLASEYAQIVAMETSCKEETKIIECLPVNNGNVVIRNGRHPTYESRLFSKTINDYQLVCGPSALNVNRQILNYTKSDPQDLHFCAQGYFKQLSETEEKLYIPQNSHDTCQNVVVYQNHTNASTTLYSLSENDYIELMNIGSIDFVHTGQNVSIIERDVEPKTNTSRSQYFFTDQLKNCVVRKRGLNFFYPNSTHLSCDLGNSSNGQKNIAVIQGNFTDSKNIDMILGGFYADRIHVSNARLVNGNGGGDTIIVNNVTAVVGHFGDRIEGQAIVLLPIGVEDILRMHVNATLNVYNKCNESISVFGDVLLKTTDPFFLTPIKFNEQTREVTDLMITKVLKKDIDFQLELMMLKAIENNNFNMIKRATNQDHDIIVAGNKHHAFILIGNNSNHYWEASESHKHLYYLTNINTTVTISKGNGLLDFNHFPDEDDPVNRTSIWNDRGNIMISVDNLRVIVLPNYKDFNVTFDKKRYYKIENYSLQRDYCSHRLTVDERFSVNGTELFNHYNCFAIDSEKVLYLKRHDNLLLLSQGKGLAIKNYFSQVYQKLDLSLALKYQLVEPEKVYERINNPNSLKKYRVYKRNLLILYHNQPKNKYHIGWINLKHLSLLKCHMEIIGNDLIVSFNKKVVLKIVNWKTYDLAREIMFAFSNAVFYNPKCVVSYCHSNDILVQFRNRRSQMLIGRRGIDSKLPNVIKRSALHHHDRKHSIKHFDNRECVMHNVSLLYYSLRAFMDQTYPMPEFQLKTHQELISSSACIANKFEQALKKTAKIFSLSVKNVDFAQLYLDILGLMKEDRYSQIPKKLRSIAESIASKNENVQFFKELDNRINKLLHRVQL